MALVAKFYSALALVVFSQTDTFWRDYLREEAVIMRPWVNTVLIISILLIVAKIYAKLEKISPEIARFAIEALERSGKSNGEERKEALPRDEKVS